MAELTQLIGLDNWRRVVPMLPVASDVVPPIYEIEIDPVPAAFQMWQDEEEGN